MSISCAEKISNVCRQNAKVYLFPGQREGEVFMAEIHKETTQYVIDHSDPCKWQNAGARRPGYEATLYLVYNWICQACSQPCTAGDWISSRGTPYRGCTAVEKLQSMDFFASIQRGLSLQLHALHCTTTAFCFHAHHKSGLSSQQNSIHTCSIVTWYLWDSQKWDICSLAVVIYRSIARGSLSRKDLFLYCALFLLD